MRFFTGVRAYDINIDEQTQFENKKFSRDLALLKSKLEWAVSRGENRRAEQIIRAIESYERQLFTEGR